MNPSPTRRSARFAGHARALLVATLVSPFARAQPGTTDPSLSSPDGFEVPSRRPTPNELVLPDASPPPMRATPGVPAPEGIAPGGGRVYPEGAFIARRTGRLLSSPGGDLIFVGEGEARREPPMVLLPCTLRTRLASALTGMPDARVVLSGQVFVYRGRHYVMPGAFALAPMEAAGEPSPTQPPAPPTTQPKALPAKPPDGGGADPDVAALIAELEARRGAPRALGPTRGAPPEALPADALPEGTLLINRRVRLVRRAEDGRYVATFDNDPGSPAPGPAVLLPCRALESIEALAAWRGENVPFMLSGRVYTMNQTRYLLPVVARPVRDAGLRPLQ